MTKALTPILFLFHCLLCAQPIESALFPNENVVNLGEVHNDDEDFAEFEKLNDILEGVEVVMLGEQSHGEATAYQTKIKLIKYLHEEMGFDILAFESGLYDCRKAWKLINDGMDVREAMAKSIFYIWSATEEFEPLAAYISETRESQNELVLHGFDSQFAGSFSKGFLLPDFTEYLSQIDSFLLDSLEEKHLLESLGLMLEYNQKELKKRDVAQDIECLNTLIEKGKVESVEWEYFQQILVNINTYLTSVAFKEDNRDMQMAENLLWLRAQYPDEKIICWGATSHFLYHSETVHMKSMLIRMLGGNYYKDQRMMGDYIKEALGDKVFTVGFVAYEGEYGLNRQADLKTPKENTLEHELAKLDGDNLLINFKGLKLPDMPSRPLGNFYMVNDITHVMDAVIFNRVMERPKLDWDFANDVYEIESKDDRRQKRTESDEDSKKKKKVIKEESPEE